MKTSLNHFFDPKHIESIIEESNNAPINTPIELLKVNGRPERLIISDEILFELPQRLTPPGNRSNIKSTIREILAKKYGTREIEALKLCCWNPRLAVIKSREIFEHSKLREQTNPNGSNGLNELLYASEEEEMSTEDINERESGGYSSSESEMSEEDINEREGNGIKYSGQNVIELSCKEIKKRASRVQIDTSKVQIGIVDFGAGDRHYDTIKNIILNEAAEHVQIHDYNVLINYRVASAMALACQIYRGIAEGMDILNISMGYYASKGNNLILNALRAANQAGMTVIFSVGNGNLNIHHHPHWCSNFAANPLVPNVISVGSSITDEESTNNLRVTRFSNFGESNFVNVYCKGIFPLPQTYSFTNSNGETKTARYALGTSFSTALITAKIAKLLRNNSLTYLSNFGIRKSILLSHLRVANNGRSFTTTGFNPMTHIEA